MCSGERHEHSAQGDCHDTCLHRDDGSTPCGQKGCSMNELETAIGEWLRKFIARVKAEMEFEKRLKK
jgi:hypothetical protein